MLENRPFLSEYLLEEIGVRRHLTQGIRERNVDVQTLEHFDELLELHIGEIFALLLRVRERRSGMGTGPHQVSIKIPVRVLISRRRAMPSGTKGLPSGMNHILAICFSLPSCAVRPGPTRGPFIIYPPPLSPRELTSTPKVDCSYVALRVLVWLARKSTDRLQNTRGKSGKLGIYPLLPHFKVCQMCIHSPDLPLDDPGILCLCLLDDI